MSSKITLEKVTTEKLFCRKLIAKTSEVFQKCNFRHVDELDSLYTSIMGRLSSGFTEAIMHDVLTLLDLHTVLNFRYLDNEAQSKILTLLGRYFRQKHE